MTWDPDRYRAFAAERAQPFRDLVRLIERDRPIHRAADLGCGSGELTSELVDELAHTTGSDDLEMVGVDSSPEMLADVAAHAGPRLTFVEGDIGQWTAAGDHDLVFANASLQWVPDHRRVLARWTAALAAGGQLAIQVPSNADHPSHRAATDVANCEPFASAMEGGIPADPVAANVLAPEQYAVLLHELGFERQHVRLQVYGHVLDSTAAVVDWVRGTTLTRFFARLPAELHEPFVETYRTHLLAVLGDGAQYFYPFKRVLLWARRSA